ncbi:hypothetical protein [Saccharopolyspora sp. ASAGF58]|uniref:hypothetical protein n=1 Tax=Saccharopolyspora sp. ASAGF58 TaxID=2719023 RepID=UPI0014463F13|nr:hypothetical protein [Saccharopolyspora sp. ASAGF58]
MSSNNEWHLTKKRSWWDGSVTTWCGQRYASGAHESDFWHLPATGGTCQACKAAKQNH